MLYDKKEVYKSIYNWNRKKNLKNFKMVYKHCFTGGWFSFKIWRIIKNSISGRYKEFEKELEERI